MKRKITAGIVTLALGALLVPAAFAASDSTQANTAPTPPSTQNQQYFNQMFDWHKTQLDNAVKNNQLTEDQAQAWSQHFDQMRDFHKQYGMGRGSGMMGNCNGYGYGPGMMGNFNTPANK